MAELPERHPLVVPVLVAAVCAISSGGVLARLAGEAEPVAIAAWRAGLAALALAPLVRPFPLRRLPAMAAAGLLLAAHFWTWFLSLRDISVMRSVLLVTLTPLWVGLATWALEGKAPRGRFWLGLVLALGGVVAMSGGSLGGASWRGDALAVVGGMLSAAYFLVGSRVRREVDFGSYGAVVCAVASLSMFAVGGATGTPLTGFSPSTWGALAALALVPQIVGHVGLNFAVRYVPATLIAALVLLEPVGATAMAAMVLGEVPGLREVAGGLVVLAGVAVIARPER